MEISNELKKIGWYGWRKRKDPYQAVIFPIHLVPPSSISSTSKLVMFPRSSLVSLSDQPPLSRSTPSASAP